MDPGNRLGHYEILAPLGAGGMGQVYRARDTTLDRDVAIKVLPEDFATCGTTAGGSRGAVIRWAVLDFGLATGYSQGRS